MLNTRAYIILLHVSIDYYNACDYFLLANNYYTIKCVIGEQNAMRDQNIMVN